MTDQEWMNPLAAPYEAVGALPEVVILVHDFTGSPAEMRPLADALHGEGYSVIVPVLDGHGTVREDLTSATRLTWQASVDRAIDAADRLSGTVHLVGYSLGGLLCMFATDQSISSLTIINPLVKFVDKSIHAARALQLVTRYQQWWAPGRGAEPSMQEFHVGYDSFPMSALVHVLEARAAAITAAEWIERPTLIVQSRRDEVVVADGVLSLRDRLVRAPVTLKWLENSEHLAVLGNELEQLKKAVIAHISNA